MKNKPSAGLIAARIASRDRIQAGYADKEAAVRYRELASRWPSSREDFIERANECDRLAALKLRSKV